MKDFLKYIISFSMVLILLVSTLQFSLYKMECLMTGNTQVSLNDFGPCGQSKNDDSISQKCCDFNNITFDFDYDTEVSSKAVKTLNFSVIIPNFRNITPKPAFARTDFSFYTNLPPPGGYELLKIVQVFRI